MLELPAELPTALPKESPELPNALEMPSELPSELPTELPKELPNELPKELPELQILSWLRLAKSESLIGTFHVFEYLHSLRRSDLFSHLSEVDLVG